MTYNFLSPGVYREDLFLRPAAALPTGVPGFVGFGKTKSIDGRPARLHRSEDLTAQFEAAPDVEGYLADAVAGFFANGGEQCYVVGADAGGDREEALKKALAHLGPLGDLDLVAVPDAMILALEEEVAAQQRVQRALLAHCHEHGDRFAILDAPGGQNPASGGVESLKAWRKKLILGGTDAANGALYYPWVKIPSSADSDGRTVPPCGHVAGIYARSDQRVGVFKAPANEELRGILDLEYPVDTTTQEGLNPEGINCLRAFPGRGLRVWGARTLSADTSWRYVNVRRLFLTLGRWVDRNLTWATFEPNTPRLWNRITRELNSYLGKLYDMGALKGTSATEAYYIKCDADTNPAEDRELGRVTTEVGLAAARPGELIVVRIIHRDGSAALST